MIFRHKPLFRCMDNYAANALHCQSTICKAGDLLRSDLWRSKHIFSLLSICTHHILFGVYSIIVSELLLKFLISE